MNQYIFTAGLLTLSVLLPPQAQSADFSRIYVFGDSLSDTGNVFAASGSKLPPSPPYFNGHFSDGRIWVEYLAEKLNLPIDPSTNFAFGGATTGTDNTLDPALPALQQEVGGYILSLNGQMADPNALYTISGGANDYLPTQSTTFTPFTEPTTTVNNLTFAVKALVNAGAKNILVVNLPDLGELPLTNNTPLANSLNALTQAHNTLLSQTLDNLPLPSDVDLFEVDVNSLFKNILNDPAKYNFTNVTDRCLTIISSTSVNICSNPNEFLFWDQIHPTTTAHRSIGNLAAQTLGVPEPSFIPGIAVLGIWGVAGILHRQRQKSSK